MTLQRSISTAALLLAASFCFGQQSASPATLPADPRWQSLITRLSSDNFADREAAQKDLEKTTWRDLPLLKQLSESTLDAEAKSRLAARLLALEEFMAYDPPPISLELKEATLPELIAAIEKATGEKFNDTAVLGKRVGAVRQGGPTFTLSAKDQPFWEVFRDLSLQHGLVLQPLPTSSGLRLTQQEPGMHPTHIVGGVAIFANSIIRTAAVNLQNPAGQQVLPPTLSFALSAVIDPRIKVLNAQPPRLFRVVDDAGNTLLDLPATPESNRVDRPSALSIGGSRPMNATISLPILEHAGKKIASAKGDLALTLQLANDTIVVADVDTKLNQPIPLAGGTILISEFTLTGTQLRFRVSVTPNPDISNNALSPISMTFIDASGQPVRTMTFTGSGGGSLSLPNLQGPLKLQFSASTKTKQVTIPFELKDLPLPGN